MSLQVFPLSVRVGIQTLRANPLRTVLSTLGVVMGAASLVAVLSVGDGMERFARQQIVRRGLQTVRISARTSDTVDNLQVPRTVQYTGGVAHEFPMGLMVAADFVHSRGSGLVYLEKNVNLISPTEYELIDPRFSYITDLTNTGYVHYTALQAQAQYRKAGRQLGVSYTLSKADSNLPSGSIYGSTPTNPFDLDVDEGPDATDQRHNFVLNGSYLFPWDFQLSGIWIYRSARPWSPYTSENPEGLVYPPWPESKNSRRGDSSQTVDFRVGKTFRFGQKVSATIFWEMFNTFNVQNFTEYDGELESSSFGYPLSALDMRRQQLGFRFDF